MASVKISVGDIIPQATFGTIPYTDELADHVSGVTSEANVILIIYLITYSRLVVFVRLASFMCP
jgi:hypothetical protein